MQAEPAGKRSDKVCQYKLMLRLKQPAERPVYSKLARQLCICQQFADTINIEAVFHEAFLPRNCHKRLSCTLESSGKYRSCLRNQLACIQIYTPDAMQCKQFTGSQLASSQESVCWNFEDEPYELI